MVLKLWKEKKPTEANMLFTLGKVCFERKVKDRVGREGELSDDPRSRRARGQVTTAEVEAAGASRGQCSRAVGCREGGRGQ